MSPTPTEPRLTSLAHGGGCGCKIAPDLLRAILLKTPGAGAHAAFMVDAATSDDAAVYRLSDDMTLVATTDFFMPIVDDPYEFGRIAATNALSDIYAMGARPIFSLAIVGMPIGRLSALTISRILEGGQTVCNAVSAPVAGGHSIDSVEPIYGLAALGLAHPDKIRTNAGARGGDVLILGKPLGVGVFSAALKQEKLDQAGYETMISSTTLLNTPGADFAEIDGVHAMTDVTGFGLLGHLSEMCIASGAGARLREGAVPVFEAARKLLADGVKTGASERNWNAVKADVQPPSDWPALSRDLFTDPQTSGGLLVACAPDSAQEVLSTFHRRGHDAAAVIGEVEDGPARIMIEA
ncbi:selenide, water dikinase SelD [Hyphococcus sp.]|uniref:selenide, water dikinase SelD n=1 Tax=Hyphococcus sp. TaxID=2038636 RepID=UPI003CCB9F25